jgi:hypothetical protein
MYALHVTLSVEDSMSVEKGYCMTHRCEAKACGCINKKEYVEYSFDGLVNNMVRVCVPVVKEELIDMDPGFVGFNMVMDRLYK